MAAGRAGAAIVVGRKSADAETGAEAVFRLDAGTDAGARFRLGAGTDADAGFRLGAETDAGAGIVGAGPDRWKH